MDLRNLSDAFQSKIRLAIIASLVTGRKSFGELKEYTMATDGNKRPLSSYTLTAQGLDEFRIYVEMLGLFWSQKKKRRCS